MSMTFQNTTKVKAIQYRPEFTSFCSIGKQPFYGNFEIEYHPGNKLLEYMAFEEWLKSLHGQEFTIESLCDCVYDKLTDELGIIPLSVMVNARTLAHYPVTCMRARTVDNIKENPVQRNMADRKIIVPPAGMVIPKSTTKRGRR
jgi:hypothetical protein